MSVLAIVLLLLNLAVAAGLATLYWRQRQALELLRTRLAALAPAALSAPPLESGAVLRPGLISIEILNPFELAARESRLAGTLSGLTPRLVQRLVLQRAAQMLRQELALRGVTAEVREHHAA